MVMVIDVYGLLAEDYETEVHVGRFYVHSTLEANRVVHELNCMTKRLPDDEQYICEYRHEEARLKKVLELSL